MLHYSTSLTEVFVAHALLGSLMFGSFKDTISKSICLFIFQNLGLGVGLMEGMSYYHLSYETSSS